MKFFGYVILIPIVSDTPYKRRLELNKKFEMVNCVPI